METERNEKETAEGNPDTAKLDAFYDLYEAMFAAIRAGIPPRTAGLFVKEIMEINMRSGWDSERDAALVTTYMWDLASTKRRPDVGDSWLPGYDAGDGI